MKELPKGWIYQDLVEITTKIGSGSTPRGGQDVYKTEGIPLIRSMNVRFTGLDAKGLAFIDDEQANKLNAVTINDKDVLLNITGASIGRVSVARDWAVGGRVNQHVCIIRPVLTEPLSAYLNYYLMTPIMQDYINSNESGATRQALTKAKIEALTIPLAPLAEQKRIVEKLDEVLAQVDTIKARLDGIPAILKHFRQSVLASAVSGKLTEEWRNVNTSSSVSLFLKKIKDKHIELKKNKKLKASFGKHEPVTPLKLAIPDRWSWTCFDEIAENDNNALKAGPFGSSLKKSDCIADGYRIYGQEQVIAGDESLVSYYISQKKYDQLRSCAIKSGDILISLVGTIGKVLILSDKVEAGIINPRLVKLSLNEKIERKYIKAYIDSPIAWQFFKGFSHGGTMDILNLGILKKLPVAIPPVEEQKEIVRLVDNYFELADTIEAQVKKAQARVDNLTQSILAKAFRGELVPQDPNDEPADKLLERIAQARLDAEALAKAAKKITGSKKKATKTAKA